MTSDSRQIINDPHTAKTRMYKDSWISLHPNMRKIAMSDDKTYLIRKSGGNEVFLIDVPEYLTPDARAYDDEKGYMAIPFIVFPPALFAVSFIWWLVIHG